jgi:hypothetical protein
MARLECGAFPLGVGRWDLGNRSPSSTSNDGREFVRASIVHRTGDNVETELSLRLAKALRRCASHGQVLSYQRFHALCEKGVPLTQRYAALESAITALADVRDIDYGVLMALDSGLPGAEFFQRYLRYRYGEYVSLMGDPKYHKQTLARKRTLVAHERERVYAHARFLVQERAKQEAFA